MSAPVIRVATFNAGNRADAWLIVCSLDADAVLVQEAPLTVPEGALIAPHARSTRRFGTAVYSRHGGLRELPASTSIEHHSHPGAVAVAELDLHGSTFTLISAYCGLDNVLRRAPGANGAPNKHPDGYAITIAHRLLSDLTGYMADGRRAGGRGGRGNAVVLGGDLNLNPGFDQRTGRRSHQLVLDRIDDFGMHSVLPVRTDDTYATCIRDPRPVPYKQIDYLFASRNVTVSHAEVLRTTVLEARRDHLPVIAGLCVSGA